MDSNPIIDLFHIVLIILKVFVSGLWIEWLRRESGFFSNQSLSDQG